VFCREKNAAFDTGPMRAMNRSAMKTTRQLDDLGQNHRLDNSSRVLPSNKSLKRDIDELSVPDHATATRISWQEE
jgi:hypothetical protein